MGVLAVGPTPAGLGAASRHVLHGACALTGQGLDHPVTLDDAMAFTVPEGAVVHLTSFRGGNSCEEMVLVVVLCGGVPVHYFPLGARSDVRLHLDAECGLLMGPGLEVQVAAPHGASADVVVDLHLLASAPLAASGRSAA